MDYEKFDMDIGGDYAWQAVVTTKRVRIWGCMAILPDIAFLFGRMRVITG